MPPDKDLEALRALEREGQARGSRGEPKRARSRRSAPPLKPSASERAATTLAGGARSTQASFLMAILLPMVIAAFAYWRTTHYGVAFGVWGLGTLVGFGLAWGMERHNARGAVAREQAWLSALPFEVQGWFEALEREPEAGRLKVTLSFANEAPDADTVRGLAAVVDATLAPGRDRVLTSHDIEVQADSDDTPNNAGYLSWQRKLLLHVLTPLHQAYPLERVRFQRA